MSLPDYATTGRPGLDEIIHNLRLGDNVVWQVETIDSYCHFVKPFVAQAQKDGKKLVYIRFGNHPPVIEKDKKVKTYTLDAAAGFESFSKTLHQIIAQEGRGAYYVFDCLSDLLSAWATDLMIGNFFLVTCPYLFELETIAYFALLRGHHSFKTIARIRETTQLMLDVYNLANDYYVHPLKVWKRHAPTMFLPHLESGDKFLPLTSSVDATRLFAYLSTTGAENARRNLDFWDRLFLEAEELWNQAGRAEEKQQMLDHLCQIMLGREKRMLALIKKHFTLADLLQIKARMVGTGFIGGKAVGMLLARKILAQDKAGNWPEKLEPHDSFFIGSDVFYSYIVENGWWGLWLEQKTEAGYFDRAAELQAKMLKGKFPYEIREQFQQIIEYFGQAPIIARSSSLLEDAFGNAFAGKYESLFDVNQGSPEERYQRFEDIIRQVFASTLNENALVYRQQRGLGQQDEQMALLVQRVSGTQHQHYFFPFLAGVGLSLNTFVWDQAIDANAGMLRLVLGLGTRAVNRVEGDYPRLVALDQPLLRPYASMEKTKKFSQHEVDVLDLLTNQLSTIPMEKLLLTEPGFDLKLIGKRDSEAEDKLATIGDRQPVWVLTFDGLLAQTDFPATMKSLLQTLQRNYKYPVDVEFTVNFNDQSGARINLVQCRPLQTRGEGLAVSIPPEIASERLVFRSRGNFMGGSVVLPVDRIILINPDAYSDLLVSKKFEVARLIGRINRLNKGANQRKTVLIGPGRWGTSDPTLGVPVNFAEINNITALVELDDPAKGFRPELSFGSHFFMDLVESDIFYAALFMDEQGVFFNKKWFEPKTNVLTQILPEVTTYQAVLHVIDLGDDRVKLLSDITSQQVVCFYD